MVNQNENRRIEHLLTGEQLAGKVRMFAKVTVFPGREIAYHEHHGEAEAYHILSGVGEYSDNGNIRPVAPGETTFCADGSGHGIRCTGGEPLVFLALIF